MTTPNVLVVHKKDAFERYVLEKRDPHLLRLLRAGNKDVLDMQRAHAVHVQSLNAVVQALKEMSVDFEVVSRGHLKVATSYDLVVAVGGDGTFLHAARSFKHTPILGVNSDPSRSEAVFCAATYQTFPRFCRKALTGQLAELHLAWLQLELNGRKVAHQALNDILVVHNDPSTMSRYRLGVGRQEEVQKSSGLWVATAAGSSSAVLAAGGVPLSWGSKRFQYRPRELYRGRLSRAKLWGGVLSSNKSVRVVWLMQRGSAFLDGPHVRIPLRFADRLSIQLSWRDPLRVLGLRS